MKAIKILGLIFIITATTHQVSLAQLGSEEAEAIERVQTRIKNLVSQTDIRGATATYYWGDEFITITSGEKKSGVPVEEDGKFMFRSFTKLLVSTIILQLQEEGALNINDAIGTYLNSINNVDPTMTIKELLSMRANVCDFMSSSWAFLSQSAPTAIYNPETILNNLIPDGNCNSRNRYEYNDTNFQLLGLIIESVTGNSGESEFENRLFSHLGEHSLALSPIDLPEDELNGTWSIVGGNITDVGATSKNSVLTAHKFNGGVVGTTEDALRMLIEIMEGEIISDESLALMKAIDSNGYGLGLMNRVLEGDEVFGHGGSGLHLSRTFYNPELKIGLSLAVNYSINQQNNAEQFLLNNYLEMKTCRENGGCTQLEEVPNEHDALAGELQQILDDNIPNYGIEGVATTIVFPNEEVHTLASGYGQTVDDPVDPTKRWHWASGTKPMTGYVTLKLIEDGLLSLEDPVGKFLDTNSIPNLDSTITVKRLLQHTSGLSEIWSSTNNSSLWQEVWGDRNRVWNPREFLDHIPTPYAGLTEHFYSGTNSYILSFIIEEVTRKSLEEVFEELIFDPLEMTTSYLSSGKEIDMSSFNGAWLGSDNRSFLSHTSYLSSRSGNSAHIATSEDAVKFYRSFYSGELLPDDVMDDVRVPAAGSSEVLFENYACISKVTQLHGYETTIFEVIDNDGDTWNLYGHGGNGIHNSFTYHWEQKDLTIAMVINDFQVLEPSPFAALIFDVLCKIDEEVEDVPEDETKPGKLVERTFTHDGTTREYSIYEPKNYDSNSTYPLILNFHGYSGDVPDHIDRTKMHDLADSLGYVIVYPVGLTITRDPDILPSFVPMTGAGWSVPGFSDERNEIQFVESLLSDIENQYSIDQSRIHTTGLSLGGYMAAYIGTQMPDRIASFASVAGHMTNEVFDLLGNETQKSGLFIHGTQDIVTNYNGLSNEYLSVESVASAIAANNKCAMDPIQTEIEDIDTSDNTTVTLFTYSDCDVVNETGLNVSLYRVNEGGHRWPGSGRTEPAGLGFNSKDISSSELIFEFFKENPYGGIIDSNEEFSDPVTFQLSQNYPNPFNPSTNISFELPEAGLVQLKVFNLLGQEVAKLVDGRMNSGNHSVNFDASQLSSGVYIYRLIAGDQSITKKMMLIK